MYEDFKWSSISNKRNALTKSYEPLQVYFLRHIAETERECIFLDVGANIGAYSILLSDIKSIVRIVAFEAMSECVNEIKKNIKRNSLEGRVNIVEIALSDKPGEARFLRTKPYGGDSAILDTYLFSRHSKDQVITVKTTTLDEHIKSESASAIIMKIDVEGHELSVLRGAENLLTSSTGWIQCEIHEKSPHRKDTFVYLNDLGWKKVFRVGWDYYFTNNDQYHNDSAALEMLESLMNSHVEASRTAPKPYRREIAPGLTVELSRPLVSMLKKWKTNFSFANRNKR